MYITNRTDVAKIAEENGIDFIWIDLETIGKAKRQGNIDSVKSNHLITDVSSIRDVISVSKLLVRVNPLFEGSKAEIDEVIARGADIIMLPMFHTTDDVKRFIDIVAGRAKVLPLVETIEAESNIDKIASIPGVDAIHIGLNDLHIAYGMKFMFELLADGHVDVMTKKIAGHGIPYGFGGIARLNEGLLPASHIIAEHYRLGSSMAILSRSFYNSLLGYNIEEIERVFFDGIKEIRDYEHQLMAEGPDFFAENQETVKMEVSQVVEKIGQSNMARTTAKTN